MLRFVFIICVLAALNFYVASRLSFLRADMSVYAIGLIAFCLTLLEVMGPVADHFLFPPLREAFGNRTMFAVIDWLSYLAIGFFSCLFIYFLAVEIGNLLHDWLAKSDPSINIERRWFLTAGFAAVGTAVAGIGQVMAGPVLREVEVALADLPACFEGFKIAQISDLHVGPLIGAEYVRKVVEKVNNLGADIVVLTGDFVDGIVKDLEGDVAPLADLRAKDGVYYVTGNHEYYWGASAWTTFFTKMGLTVLANEHRVIKREGDEIVLAGVTDYSTSKTERSDASNPVRSLAGAPMDRIKILLAHQPNSYTEAHKAGFDLQLSGHTHAGQYFPLSVVFRLFTRYYKGLNRHENMWIYVNSGTGYWGPPFRTGVPSEITLLKLKNAV